MRPPVNIERLRSTLKILGDEARSPGCIFLVGGATALLYGWRNSTMDIDLCMSPEPQGVFEAIRRVKDRQQVSIELASPPDFIPEVSGWRDRCVWICRHGNVDFFHYDLVSQALAKLERAHIRDLADVTEMVAAGLVSRKQILEGFETIRSGLLRYPGVDEDAFERRVQAFVSGEKP
jgi:hypothetical protein